MKTKVEQQPRFTSLVEVLEDAKCKDFINAQLDKISHARRMALTSAPSGAKLRKGPYDLLFDLGKLHPVGFVEEFKLIDQKKSNLPAAARGMITDICLHSMQETINYWQKIDEAPVAKKPRAKKKVATEVTAQ